MLITITAFRNEQDELPGFAYEDASVFKMGSCQLFSLALAKRFGYEAIEAIGEDGRLIHAFCRGNYLGRDAGLHGLHEVPRDRKMRFSGSGQ